MVVDSSAWIAILDAEHDAGFLALELQQAASLRTSAATKYETSVVILRKRGEAGVAALAELLSELSCEVVPFSERQADIALRAFMQFGKGRSAAALNFGDCLAYALAKETGDPLLCKGNDFVQTDLTCITPPVA